MRIISILILTILGIAILGGCAAPGNGGGAALEDTRWVLQGYGQPGNLQAVLGDRTASATFNSAEGTVTGSTGCNSYFGGYDLRGDKINISGPVGQTEMACEEPLMTQETAYLALLQAMQSYEIDGSQLTLNCEGGVLVYTAE